MLSRHILTTMKLFSQLYISVIDIDQSIFLTITEENMLLFVVYPLEWLDIFIVKGG